MLYMTCPIILNTKTNHVIYCFLDVPYLSSWK